MWAADKCVNATFTIKMDDDIAVNFYEIVDILRKEVSGGASVWKVQNRITKSIRVIKGALQDRFL